MEVSDGMESYVVVVTGDINLSSADSTTMCSSN